MDILKKVAVKRIMHDAGFTRVSSKALTSLNKAVVDMVKELAKDAAIVYDAGQLEAHELERLTKVKTYGIKIILIEPKDIDIRKVLKEEGLEGFDGEEIDEPDDEDEGGAGA